MSVNTGYHLIESFWLVEPLRIIESKHKLNLSLRTLSKRLLNPPQGWRLHPFPIYIEFILSSNRSSTWKCITLNATRDIKDTAPLKWLKKRGQNITFDPLQKFLGLNQLNIKLQK